MNWVQRKGKQSHLLLRMRNVCGRKAPLASTVHRLCSMLFFFSNFALRSGSENRALCYDNCQLTVVEVSDQHIYLQYVEDISKNNAEGPREKITPKKVIQYANLDNTSRCPVRLFKLYNNLCPKQPLPTAFYLQP